MSNYKIEDNVKSPHSKTGNLLKYPFDKMEIGQSFRVTIGEDPTGGRIRKAASSYYRRHPEYCFRVSADKCGVDSGWRVWRVDGSEVVSAKAQKYPSIFSKSDVAEMEVARKAVVTAPTTEMDDNGQAEYERDMAAALSELRAEAPGTSEVAK